MNDHEVSPVSLSVVLSQKAYMLFYSKTKKDESNARVILPTPPLSPVKNSSTAILDALDAARNEAKNSKKFLLVTVVDKGELDNPHGLDLVKSKNVIIVLSFRNLCQKYLCQK